MIAATSFCIAMLMGFGIGCSGERSKQPVIDRTCDLRVERMPPEWRAQCVGPDKKMRRDVPAATQRWCKNQLANERIIKKRCPPRL